MWRRVVEYNDTRGVQILDWTGNIIHAIQLKYKLSGRHETCPWLWRTQQIWPNTSSPVYCGQVARSTPKSFCPYTKPAPGSSSCANMAVTNAEWDSGSFLHWVGSAVRKAKRKPCSRLQTRPDKCDFVLAAVNTPTTHPPHSFRDTSVVVGRRKPDISSQWKVI